MASFLRTCALESVSSHLEGCGSSPVLGSHPSGSPFVPAAPPHLLCLTGAQGLLSDCVIGRCPKRKTSALNPLFRMPLRPQTKNVLMTKEGGTAKIGDVGLAQFLEHQENKPDIIACESPVIAIVPVVEPARHHCLCINLHRSHPFGRFSPIHHCL